MNFADVKEITALEGSVIKIMCGTQVLWEKIVGLPSEYQEVEWIKAEEKVGAYIDLGFVFDTKAKIYLNQIVTNRAITSYPFGAAENSGVLRCMLSCPYSNTAYAYGSNGSSFLASALSNILNDGLNEFEIIYEKGNFKFTNLSNGLTNVYHTQADYIMTNNLYLFAQNYNGSPRFGGVRIIGKFQYYDKNDELICDLIPCYRKSDGVIGMYDLVRRLFLTNVGSGTFAKGPEILLGG